MSKLGKVKAGAVKVVRVGGNAVKKAKELAASARSRLNAVNAKVKSKATGLKYAAASVAGAAITGVARGLTDDGEVMGFDAAHAVAAVLGVAGAMVPGETGNMLVTAAGGAEGPVVADLVEDLVRGDGA